MAGDRTFVAGCDSALHVIDVKTGKELTSVDLGGQAAATAAVVGDQLYVGTMANEVQAVDWKKGELRLDLPAGEARRSRSSRRRR